MPVVLLVLALALFAVAAGLLVAMYVKRKPILGVVALAILLGPGTTLAFSYLVAA
jgi:hypothetical protein